MNRAFSSLGLRPATILLPRNCDMRRWAVVACDQFTSQPEYWQEAERLAGDAPSSLRLILPESRLDTSGVDGAIAGINRAMEDYLARNLFTAYQDAIFYIERTQSDGAVRRGLVAAVDLEQYDYTPGSASLIRATEGTVLERIPPRVRVRRNAPLELPHAVLWIDDPQKTCLEPLAAGKAAMELLYDFDLMLGGGHITGWRLTDTQQDTLAAALAALISPKAMEEKYGLTDAAPLLMAVGDGNHSLAAAKTCYEERKKEVPESQWAELPARYALVEVENLHDNALALEAIHRVLFGVEPEAFLAELNAFYPHAYEGRGDGHAIEVIWPGHDGWITIPTPPCPLAVDTLQRYLDAFQKTHPCRMDYIHGEDVARKLGAKPGNMAFLLPAMEKSELFKTVITGGVLPRKTFSLGHAEDKRYYVEARRIR